jgi:hypothetical protein
MLAGSFSRTNEDRPGYELLTISGTMVTGVREISTTNVESCD